MIIRGSDRIYSNTMNRLKFGKSHHVSKIFLNVYTCNLLIPLIGIYLKELQRKIYSQAGEYLE